MNPMMQLSFNSMGEAAIIESANRFAMILSAITILLLVLSAVLHMVFANRWTIGWLHLSPIAIQPAWLMPATAFDNGSMLRVVSLAFLIGALLAFLMALYLCLFVGTRRQPIRIPRLSIQQWMLLVFFVVIAIVIARPPISDEFSRAWSLSLLGFIYTLAFAFYPRSRYKLKSVDSQTSDT
jgi:hypothetical protein